MLNELKKLIYEYPDGHRITRFEANNWKLHFLIQGEYEEQFDNIEDALLYQVSNSLGKDDEDRPVMMVQFSESRDWGDEGQPGSPTLVATKYLKPKEEMSEFFQDLLEQAETHVKSLEEVYKAIEHIEKQIRATKVKDTDFIGIKETLQLLIKKVEKIQKTQGYSTDEENCIHANLHAMIETIELHPRVMSKKQKRLQLLRRIDNINQCP